MARSVKNYADEFVKYQEIIRNHPNYKGLAFGKGWVTTGQLATGQQRKNWADKKIAELGITGLGKYAKLMYQIHPTRAKPCQTCGKVLNLDYIYPNKNLANSLLQNFPYLGENSDDLTIIDIYQINNTITPKDKTLFRKIIGQKLKQYEYSSEISTENLIDALVCESRMRISNQLGPGAMSNFPDRFDGFHTYNRCCRSKEDSGRSSENLKTYTKDRRAYEMWSDGNHRAANQLMGNKIFKNTGLSADHLGPISLGFVHDSHFMVPISTGDNSSKRDRLLLVDLQKIIAIENRERLVAMSWYANVIWDEMKSKISSGEIVADEDLLKYQNILKINKDMFFRLLYEILQYENGEDFLKFLLTKNYTKDDNHLHDYEIDIDEKGKNFGKIIQKSKRNITKRANNEQDRGMRIAIDAVIDYVNKENRHIYNEITEAEKSYLSKIENLIQSHHDYKAAEEYLIRLMEDVQNKFLAN